MVLVIKTTGVEDYLDGGGSTIKALFMGAPSAGKTRSASFWPKPIFADCEKGRMSIADRGVPYAEITSTADMDKLIEILELECRKPERDRRYQTLVIDTLDAFQRIVIQERLDAEKKESLSGWSDWGYLDAKMTQFVAKVTALPMNLVMNVHIKESSVGGDDETKAVQLGFKLKGDLRDQIAADFDLVGYMGTYWEAEGGERVLKRGVQWHAEPTKPFLKDRSGQLPKWTPIRFAESDFDDLRATLTRVMDGLGESQELERHETDPAITVAPAPPRAGGPVAPAQTPRKAAPAKAAPKAAPAAPETGADEAQQTATPVGRVTSNVPPAKRPEIPGATSAPEPAPAPEPVQEPEAAPEPPQEAAAEAEAPAMAPEEVAAALGGEVISSQIDADASSTGDEPEEQAGDVAVDEVVEQGADGALYCGSPFDGAEPNPDVTGCGAEIKTVEQGGSDQAMLVEIAQLKTRTNLCNACFAAYRAASKKG